MKDLNKVYIIGNSTEIGIGKLLSKLDEVFDEVEFIEPEQAKEMSLEQYTRPAIPLTPALSAENYFQPPPTRAQRRALQRKLKK